jgi:metal-responsive CopG/Arc/MetJ family transcriptional regulator
MARFPDELVEFIEQVGREQGSRGRSEALRKAIELLRELKNSSVNRGSLARHCVGSNRTHNAASKISLHT